MENQTQLTSKSSKQTDSSKIKPILLAALLTIGIIIAGTGVYFWQHDKVNELSSEVGYLQTKLKSASQPSSTSTDQDHSTAPDTFIYSPQTGGLSLKLSKAYGVVVSVDGNKGGAPGARFRIASTINANVFNDSSYQGVQVDVDHVFKTLNQAVSAKETELTEEGGDVDRNYRVSDATVAGLPAKLLKADGLDEYQGDLAIYLVGSGEFLYSITANGLQNDNSAELAAVLKGISIKPATL